MAKVQQRNFLSTTHIQFLYVEHVSDLIVGMISSKQWRVKPCHSTVLKRGFFFKFNEKLGHPILRVHLQRKKESQLVMVELS